MASLLQVHFVSCPFALCTLHSRLCFFSYLKDTILFLSIGTEDLLFLSRNTLCLLYTLLLPFIIFALPWLNYQLYLYLSSLSLCLPLPFFSRVSPASSPLLLSVPLPIHSSFLDGITQFLIYNFSFLLCLSQ